MCARRRPGSRVPGMRRSVAPGSLLALPLTSAEADRAEVRVLLDPSHAERSARENLRIFGDGVLVEVRYRGQSLIPGMWADPRILQIPVEGHESVRAADLRLPAVILGSGAHAQLAWGETRWPMALDSALAIPQSCRPGVHSAAQLRRLALVALGRRDEVALTLWQDPAMDVPWHDVRLVPHAAAWFSAAQVPVGMRYADAADWQGFPVERLLREEHR